MCHRQLPASQLRLSPALITEVQYSFGPDKIASLWVKTQETPGQPQNRWKSNGCSSTPKWDRHRLCPMATSKPETRRPTLPAALCSHVVQNTKHQVSLGFWPSSRTKTETKRAASLSHTSPCRVRWSRGLWVKSRLTPKWLALVNGKQDKHLRSTSWW